MDNSNDEPPFKRQRGGNDDEDENDDDNNNNNNTTALIVVHSSINNEDDTANAFDDSAGGGVRSSTLPSPTLALTGHKGSVYSLKYSPNGEILCSTSFDMTILLWDHTSRYENFNILTGHTNAVLDCAWCDDETIASVSADKTVMLWDITTGQRLRKWSKQHTGIINSCSTAPNGTSVNLLATGSDDGTCRIWDRRSKFVTAVFETEYPILGVAMTSSLDSTTSSNPQVFTAGIDNRITCWDIRQQRKVYSMKGHTDTITSLAVHPKDSTHLLSNSMDQTVKLWDIQPYITTKNRHVKTFVGHKHNAEKGLLKCNWSADGTMITAGSSDRLVHIWDEYSTEELYVLPGHKGCVNTVTFHPQESNVIASGGSDNIIYVGELS